MRQASVGATRTYIVRDNVSEGKMFAAYGLKPTSCRRGGAHKANYAYYYSSEKKNNGSNTLRKPYNSVK